MINNQLFKKVHGCNVAGYVGAALGEPSRRDILVKIMEDRKKQIRTIESLMK